MNHDFIYVGFTQDLRKRFKEHNKRHELSTKHYAPFDLIHYEAYKNIKDSKRREEYFKTTKGKVTLKQMLREYFKGGVNVTHLEGGNTGGMIKAVIHS